MSSLSKRKGLWRRLSVLALLVVTMSPLVVLAQQAPAAAPDLATQVADLTAKVASSKVAADTMWTLLTAFLVFWMNAGFALVESGFCRAKNAVNILSKNFIVFALSSLAFYVVGWGLMFGNGNAFMGTDRKSTRLN